MTKTQKRLYIAVFVVTLLLVAVCLITTNTDYAQAASGLSPTALNYKWTLDGVEITDKTIYLQRNGEFSGVISVWQNNKQLSGTLKDVSDVPIYLTIDNANHRVAVKPNAQLTYGSQNTLRVTWVNDAGLQITDNLTICVLPSGPITLKAAGDLQIAINNVDRRAFNSVSETVSVKIKVTNQKNSYTYNTFTVTDGTSLNATIYDISGYFYSGTLKVSIESVTYTCGANSISYDASTHPEIASNSVINVTGYFANGNGTSLDPYQITNLAQLNNIRKMADSNSVISGSYAIMQEFAVGLWEPIAGTFNGTLDGNHHELSEVHIQAGVTGDNVGLFQTVGVSGRVLGVVISGLNIDTSTSYAINIKWNIGAVAGVNYGTISYCDVGGTITNDSYNANVGGIVGINNGGTVNHCENNANITACGIMGGIVGLGKGSGLITDCRNNGAINYLFDTVSGCAGGIAGKLESGAITFCANSGQIKYASPKEYNSNIRPCMANIVGWDVTGKVGNDNTLAGRVDYTNTYLGQQRYISSNNPAGRTGN